MLCGWSDLFGFVGLIWAHPGGRRVHSCSLGVGFIWARPGRRRVHSDSFAHSGSLVVAHYWSFGTFRCALGDVAFIRIR